MPDDTKPTPIDGVAATAAAIAPLIPMPWGLIVTAVATGAPPLISKLLALYDKHKAGQLVTAAEWEAFELEYLNQTAEQRLLAIARRAG